MYFLAHDAPFSCRKAYRKLKDREARQHSHADIMNRRLAFLMGRDQNRRDGVRMRTDSRSRSRGAREGSNSEICRRDSDFLFESEILREMHLIFGIDLTK